MQPALLPSVFGDRHLLGIEGLSAGAITYLLDLSESYVALNREVQKRRSLLGGRTVLLLFFETSTRTRTSFEARGQAARRRRDQHRGSELGDQEGRDAHRHGDDAQRHAPRHADHAPPRCRRRPAARRSRRVRRHQRRRRLPRASHPGAAGRAHHPPPLRPHPGAQGRHLRRCAAQPGRALQHPAAQRDGGERPRHRAADAAAGGGRAPRRRGLPRHARRPRRLRRHHDAAPAAGAHAGHLRAVDPRIFPLLRPGPGQARRGQAGGADPPSGAR